MKIKQANLRCNAKHIQVINPMGIGALWFPFSQHLPAQLQTWITQVTALKAINVLME